MTFPRFWILLVVIYISHGCDITFHYGHREESITFSPKENEILAHDMFRFCVKYMLTEESCKKVFDTYYFRCFKDSTASSYHRAFLSLLTHLHSFSGSNYVTHLQKSICKCSGHTNSPINLNSLVPLTTTYDEFVDVINSLALKVPMLHVPYDSWNLHTALSFADPGGVHLVFGVYWGESIKFMLNFMQSCPFCYQSTVIYGFDSFEGIPEAWSQYPAHHFSTNGLPPFSETPQLQWRIGWFNETLPHFIESKLIDTEVTAADYAVMQRRSGFKWRGRERERLVSFIHIDSDLYSSASTVLSALAPYLAPVVVILFDELINYVDYEHNEIKALWEFYAALCATEGPDKVALEMLPVGAYNVQSVAFRLTFLG